MFDPCGTRHADGEELIKRLAKHLNMNPVDLEAALRAITLKQENLRLFNNPTLDDKGGCGCGD